VQVDEESAGDALLYYASVDERDDGPYRPPPDRSRWSASPTRSARPREIAEDALAVAGEEGLRVRHDIGKADLIQRRIDHMTELRGE